MFLLRIGSRDQLAPAARSLREQLRRARKIRRELARAAFLDGARAIPRRGKNLFEDT